MSIYITGGTKSTHTANDVRDAILDDATRFSGADIAAILTDTGTTLPAILTIIRAVTDAMPVLENAFGTITTDGTEQDVYINDAPAGVFLPICVDIDFTNQTAAETTVVKHYKRMKSGGAMVSKTAPTTYAGIVADPKVRTITLQPNRFGIKVTIQRTAIGVDRDYDHEAYYKV